jgi:hypothetical protein
MKKIKKVSQSKIGTKSLYKDGKMKKAKPDSDKWNNLINDGWCIKEEKLNGRT